MVFSKGGILRGGGGFTRGVFPGRLFSRGYFLGGEYFPRGVFSAGSIFQGDIFGAGGYFTEYVFRGYFSEGGKRLEPPGDQQF